jgi:hypothetical protein
MDIPTQKKMGLKVDDLVEVDVEVMRRVEVGKL